MDDENSSATNAFVVRIGIRGLPDLISSMTGGGLYVLIAKTTSARFPMLAGSIANALEDGLACTLIAPANPGPFVQRIETLAQINTADLVAANQLQIFVVQDNFLKKIFQFGAERFVSELDDFEIPEDSYLVFDQADELLSLHDVSLALEQVSVLRKWFSRKKITALLVFSRFTEAHNNTVNAIMDNLDGIVRLGGERDGLELTFDYWQSTEGVVVAKNYQLSTLDTGLYEVSLKPAVLSSFQSEEKYQALGRELSMYAQTASFNAPPAFINPARYSGYLPVLSFATEVHRIIDQAARTPIACMLIVGKLVQPSARFDLIKSYSRLAGLGELITADQENCYIFLNTNLQQEALKRLDEIFGMPVDKAFQHTKILVYPEEINLELNVLSVGANREKPADFSLKKDGYPSPQAGHFAGHDLNEKASRFDPRPEVEAFSASVQRNKKSLPSMPPETEQKLFPAEPGEVFLLDFEPAKRSVAALAGFSKVNRANDFTDVVAKTLHDPLDEMIFSYEEDVHGPVFEKKEAPRARRALS